MKTRSAEELRVAARDLGWSGDPLAEEILDALEQAERAKLSVPTPSRPLAPLVVSIIGWTVAILLSALVYRMHLDQKLLVQQREAAEAIAADSVSKLENLMSAQIKIDELLNSQTTRIEQTQTAVGQSQTHLEGQMNKMKDDLMAELTLRIQEAAKKTEEPEAKDSAEGTQAQPSPSTQRSGS